MAPKTKNKFTVGIIAGVCAAVLTITALIGKIDAYTKEKYLYPCIKSVIEKENKYRNEKIDVIYEYNKKKAKRDGAQDLWNEAYDEVMANKDSKIQKLR